MGHVIEPTEYEDTSSMTFTLLGSKHKDNLSSINQAELDEEMKMLETADTFKDIQTTEMHDDDMQTRIWAQFVRPSRNSESHKRTNSGPNLKGAKPQPNLTGSTKLKGEKANALVSGDAGGAYSAFSESRLDSGSVNSKDTASLDDAE